MRVWGEKSSTFTSISDTFPRSTQTRRSTFSLAANVFHSSNASMFRCFYIAHSLPHHKHQHSIEVIKLVIVFFFSLVWPSSAWDILEDARFFPLFILFTPRRRCMGKHQRTLSRLRGYLLFEFAVVVILSLSLHFFGESSPVQQIVKLRRNKIFAGFSIA
jgi:hypothetical protein